MMGNDVFKRIALGIINTKWCIKGLMLWRSRLIGKIRGFGLMVYLVFFEDFLDYLAAFFVTVPGIVLTVFSIYFAWQKLGTSVRVSYVTGLNRSNAPRITELIFVNKKNNPVVVYEVLALVDDEFYFTVEKLNPPQIISAFESLHVHTSPYSRLEYQREDYSKRLMRAKSLVIYISTSSGIKKCKSLNIPFTSMSKSFKDYFKPEKLINKYNEKVYSDNVRYVIIYKKSGALFTAFIDRAGFIFEDWNYRENMLPIEALASKESVVKALEDSGLAKRFDAFSVDDLDEDVRL